MIETNLSISDFKNFFEYNRLGKLYFPKGRILDNQGRYEQLRINLRAFYKFATGWKVNHTEVPLEEIIGIITYGPAVAPFIDDDSVKKRRKYVLFGPKIIEIKKDEDLDIDYVNFLVITEEDSTGKEGQGPKEIFPPIYLPKPQGYIQKLGIRILYAGIDKVVANILANDTTCVGAMKYGVPVFFDERLGDAQARTGITRENQMKLLWDEDDYGCIFGKIVRDGNRS